MWGLCLKPSAVKESDSKTTAELHSCGPGTPSLVRDSAFAGPSPDQIALGEAMQALDDSALSHVLALLEDCTSLASCAQVCRRWNAVIVSYTWRRPFEQAFPHWAARMQHTGAAAPLDYRAAYRHRHIAERNWARARARSEALVSHAGPVFATAFLQAPFPAGLAISAGVFGHHERAELTLWDMSRPVMHVGRLGWQLLSPLAGGQHGEEDNLCGAFDVHQRPGKRQVVVCGFTPDVNVYSLSRRGEGAGKRDTNSSSSASRGGREVGGESGVAGDELGGQIERLLQLRASTNLHQGEGLNAAHELPEPGEAWQARHVMTLVGHDSACPTARCQEGSLVATASFDGSIKLWRLPDEQLEPGWLDSEEEEEGESGSGSGREGRQVAPWASYVDPVAEAAYAEEPHSKAVCDLALKEDLSAMASGSNDTLVKLWSVETQQVVSRLEGHGGWVWNVEALDQSFQTIISGGTDGTVRVWDTRTGGQVSHVSFFQPDESPYPVAGLGIRPDRHYLAAGCFDANIYVVDLRALKVAGALKGHTDRVTRLACQDDQLLSASFDGNARLWDFSP